MPTLRTSTTRASAQTGSAGKYSQNRRSRLLPAASPRFHCRKASISQTQCALSARRSPLMAPVQLGVVQDMESMKHFRSNRHGVLGSRTRRCRALILASGAAAGLAKQEEPDKQVGPSNIKRLLVVSLCSMANMLSVSNRTMLSLAGLPMATEYGWSTTQFALLQSAYLAGYPLTQLLGGVLADVLGGRLLYAWAVTIWSVSTLATPLLAPVGGLAAVCACRFVFGMASGICIPGGAAVVAQWSTKALRGLSLSMLFTGLPLGALTGLVVCPYLIDHLGGWATPFYALGAVGLVWALAWSFATKTDANSGITTSIDEGEKVSARDLLLDLLSMLRRPRIWGLMWVHLCLNYIYFVTLAWTPFYLRTQLGASMETTAILSTLPHIGMAGATMLGGTLAELMLSWGWEFYQVRRAIMGIACLGPAAAMSLLATVSTPGPAIACIFFALSTLAVSQAGFHAYVQDVAPKQAGRVIGVTNTGGTVFGFFGTAITGVVREATGSFAAVFLSTGALCLSGFVVFWLVSSGGLLFPQEKMVVTPEC